MKKPGYLINDNDPEEIERRKTYFSSCLNCVATEETGNICFNCQSPLYDQIVYSNNLCEFFKPGRYERFKPYKREDFDTEEEFQTACVLAYIFEQKVK